MVFSMPGRHLNVQLQKANASIGTPLSLTFVPSRPLHIFLPCHFNLFVILLDCDCFAENSLEILSVTDWLLAHDVPTNKPGEVADKRPNTVSSHPPLPEAASCSPRKRKNRCVFLVFSDWTMMCS